MYQLEFHYLRKGRTTVSSSATLGWPSKWCILTSPIFLWHCSIFYRLHFPNRLNCFSGEASKAPDLNKEELLNFYGGESKRSCDSLESETSGSKASSDCLELSTEINEDSLVSPTQKSPVFATKRNPFALRSKHKSSAKKNNVGALAKFTLAANSEDLLISRFVSKA